MIPSFPRTLLIGDLVVLALLTLLGFATHQQVGAWYRMAVVFTSVGFAWLWTAPWLGLFREDLTRRPGQIWWRTAWAWTLAGPLGLVLRAIWLDAPLIPLFAMIFVGLNGLGFVLWRTAYAWWAGPRTMASGTAPSQI